MKTNILNINNLRKNAKAAKNSFKKLDKLEQNIIKFVYNLIKDK